MRNIYYQKNPTRPLDIFRHEKYNTTKNKIKYHKPMIKSSNSGIDLAESRRWWDCGRKIRSEWTYEGRRTARRMHVHYPCSDRISSEPSRN